MPWTRAKRIRITLDHVEDTLAERCDQALRERRSDTLDQARSEEAAQVVLTLRVRHGQRLGFELGSMRGVPLPGAVRLDELADRDAGNLSDDGDGTAIAPRAHLQHAESRSCRYER